MLESVKRQDVSELQIDIYRLTTWKWLDNPVILCAVEVSFGCFFGGVKLNGISTKPFHLSGWFSGEWNHGDRFRHLFLADVGPLPNSFLVAHKWG